MASNARAKYDITAEDKTKNAIRGVKRNFKDLGSVVSDLRFGLVALAGAGGLGAVVTRTIDAQDEIGKLSQRIGASTQALSQYRFVADRTGVSFNTLTMGFQRMTRRISEAAAGTGEARGALQELGLSARELNQLRPEQQFEALADSIMKVKSPADQVRLAMKLFDSEGVSLIQTMQGGSEAIRGLRDRADELGLTLSQQQVKAAAEANDAMTELRASFEGMSNSLTTDLAPALTDLIELLTDFVPKAANLARSVTEDIGVSITAIWDYLNPSDITGPTTFQKSVDAAMQSAKQLREETARLREQQTSGGGGGIISDLGGKPSMDKGTSKALADFGFEDAKTRQHVLDTRFEQLKLAQQNEFDMLMQFEDAKTAMARQGIIERLEFSKWGAKQQTKHVIGEAIRLTQGVSGESRKLFEINKAAGIANAIINTHEGVTKSLSKYPWPLAGAMAALHLASGLAQVQAIKSTSFGGGGGAPSLAAAGGTPSNPVPQQSLDTDNTNRGSEIVINIEGNVFANDDFRLALVQALEQAQANDEVIIRAN